MDLSIFMQVFDMQKLNVNILITIIVLVFCSAFFSASETAFSSANKLRLKSYMDEGKRGAKTALYIAENYDQTISTILVGNNIANILMTTFSVMFFWDLLINEAMVETVSTVVMLVIVLIFGEVMPKSFAKNHAESFCLKTSYILRFLTFLFLPITFFLSLLQSLLKPSANNEPTVTESELESIIDTMEDEGVIEEDEADLLQSVLELDETSCDAIMTEVDDVFAIDLSLGHEEIKEKLLNSSYTRVPAYINDLNNIVGILHVKDFYISSIKNKKFEFVDLLRRAYFVSQYIKIDKLIEELQKHKKHIAIVLDDKGHTAGIVTLEDALEEIVGEIYDEDDKVDLVELFEAEEEDEYILQTENEINYFLSEVEFNNNPELDLRILKGEKLLFKKEISQDIDREIIYEVKLKQNSSLETEFEIKYLYINIEQNSNAKLKRLTIKLQEEKK